MPYCIYIGMLITAKSNWYLKELLLFEKAADEYKKKLTISLFLTTWHMDI